MHTSDNLCLSTSTPNNALETPQDPFTLFCHLVFGREQQDHVVARQGGIQGGIEGERREVDQLQGGLEFRGAAVEIGRGFSRWFLKEERSEMKELARGTYLMIQLPRSDRLPTTLSFSSSPSPKTSTKPLPKSSHRTAECKGITLTTLGTAFPPETVLKNFESCPTAF